MLESAANAPGLFDRLSLFFLSAFCFLRISLASAGLGNGFLNALSAAIFSGLCGGGGKTAVVIRGAAVSPGEADEPDVGIPVL